MGFDTIEINLVSDILFSKYVKIYRSSEFFVKYLSPQISLKSDSVLYGQFFNYIILDVFIEDKTKV